MRHTKQYFIWGALIIVVVLAVLAVWGSTLFGPPLPSTTVKDFVIQEGEGVQSVARRLQEEGLIKNATAFSLYVWLNGKSSSLQAGEYELTPSMTVGAVVSAFTGGQTGKKEVTVRLLEGWTSEQMGGYLANKIQLFSVEEWEAAVNVSDTRTILPNETFSFLAEKPVSATLEGYLFPDTYRVFANATPANVIQKMLETFDQKFTQELRDAIAEQNRTIFDVVVLASIIEREVRGIEDQRLAADVFLKRLEEGIALQSDATVNYVTGKQALRPTADDLTADSPYNTYKYPGLPPGPIGNPGLGALDAVVHPEPNPYYYFLTTEEGTAVFSETYTEHLQNIQQFLE